MQELGELERDSEKRLRQTEKRIYELEHAYINSSLIGSGGVPLYGGFGNLISGWEGLLEGKAVDKRKASEKVFSGSSETWLMLRRDVEQKKRLLEAEEASTRGGQASGGGGGGGGVGMNPGLGGAGGVGGAGYIVVISW